MCTIIGKKRSSVLYKSLLKHSGRGILCRHWARNPFFPAPPTVPPTLATHHPIPLPMPSDDGDPVWAPLGAADRRGCNRNSRRCACMATLVEGEHADCDTRAEAQSRGEPRRCTIRQLQTVQKHARIGCEQPVLRHTCDAADSSSTRYGRHWPGRFRCICKYDRAYSVRVYGGRDQTRLY